MKRRGSRSSSGGAAGPPQNQPDISGNHAAELQSQPASKAPVAMTLAGTRERRPSAGKHMWVEDCHHSRSSHSYQPATNIKSCWFPPPYLWWPFLSSSTMCMMQYIYPSKYKKPGTPFLIRPQSPQVRQPNQQINQRLHRVISGYNDCNLVFPLDGS